MVLDVDLSPHNLHGLLGRNPRLPHVNVILQPPTPPPPFSASTTLLLGKEKEEETMKTYGDALHCWRPKM